jgi:acyl CoA:acetate/3-ketoacid CoA transferase alpha subunit
MAINKIVSTMDEAVSGMCDGAMIHVGGFGTIVLTLYPKRKTITIVRDYIDYLEKDMAILQF